MTEMLVRHWRRAGEELEKSRGRSGEWLEHSWKRSRGAGEGKGSGKGEGHTEAAVQLIRRDRLSSAPSIQSMRDPNALTPPSE